MPSNFILPMYMMPNKAKTSCAVVYTILALILALIVIANGIVVLYACLVWHHYDNEINVRFMVGITIFVTCTTLPFALITGYLVIFLYTYLICRQSQRHIPTQRNVTTFDGLRFQSLISMMGWILLLRLTSAYQPGQLIIFIW